MGVTVTARQRIPDTMQSYAKDKLSRLSRHAYIHDVSMVIERDGKRAPACSAEVIVHLHHTRLAAKATAPTVQEAIDLVMDKADRQILKHKDRVIERKGRTGADGEPLTVEADGSLPEADDSGIVSERCTRLQPLSRVDALAEAERRGDSHFFFLDEERGDVSLLLRRAAGGYDLVVTNVR